MDHKFSIITPEHDPNNAGFLREAWHSIQAQTHANWEWILFLNGDCTFDHIPDEIKDDPRVVLFRSFDSNTNIGSIKKQAFDIGTGDILVELDHDDLLLPHCLQKLNEAFQDTEIGFVFSDDIHYNMQQPFEPYSPEHGWTWRWVTWRDNQHRCMHSWPVTSHSVSFIWYAPDHDG